ncbi:MAG UNVERIFIED_CONTAM: DNA replication/repair protein RecF [Rickettsiaceae bacterium]|jgi:DNA replication and repair protein RecF
MKVRTIDLNNYRNFENRKFIFEPDISIIIGPNGAGKTNLLEAISLFTPGKGLRNALPEAITKFETNSWNISAICNSKLEEAALDIVYSKDIGKKTLCFNGTKISNSELSNFMNIIWLTPQMDGLFLGSPSERRKFLDRMVFSSIKNHAQIINKYEYHQKERLKILETNPQDNQWLDIVEKSMADLAVTIIENRLGVIYKINQNLSIIDSAFPKAKLELESDIINILDKENPIEHIMVEFRRNRTKDQISGRTNFGPQKCDMRTYYGTTNIPAEDCSTGEQKALLISIIIAKQLSELEKPILLLDEIFVHLDEERRKSLGEFLVSNKSQVFITSTEIDIANYLSQVSIIEML